jgi:hypothetical protein
MPRFGKVETEGRVLTGQRQTWWKAAEIRHKAARHNDARDKFTVAASVALAG